MYIWDHSFKTPCNFVLLLILYHSHQLTLFPTAYCQFFWIMSLHIPWFNSCQFACHKNSWWWWIAWSITSFHISKDFNYYRTDSRRSYPPTPNNQHWWRYLVLTRIGSYYCKQEELIAHYSIVLLKCLCKRDRESYFNLLRKCACPGGATIIIQPGILRLTGNFIVSLVSPYN